jgi:spermidine/putrescine transport system permease protein
MTTHQDNPFFRRFSITLITAWLAVFVLLPTLMVTGTSVLTRDDSHFVSLPLTLSGYARLFDPLYAGVFTESFVMAGIATTLCLLIGYPYAWITARAARPWRYILLLLVIVPFWTNSLIRTYAVKLVLATNGALNTTLFAFGYSGEPLQLLYTPFAVVAGLVYVLLPFMILPLYAVIEKLDMRLLEAAADLGATPLRRFLRVTLPLTLPGIIAGCLLVFLPALGLFYVSDVLGGSRDLLIGNLVKSQFLVARDWPFGAAVSIALIVVMGVMIAAWAWSARRANQRVGGG